MASRAVWKGQLRLSLVSIPVEMYPATESGARIRFRQIHGPSGQPVRYEKSVPGFGPVKSEDILKAYELENDEYLLLEPQEIDDIKLETRKTLELVQFVELPEISPLYYDKPYYVVATDELAEEAYRVLRDALRKADKVGLGQLTMRGREHRCALKPCGDGLLLETLRYADEIRAADPLFSTIEDDAADPDLLAVATQLIERKSAPFDASAFEDSFATALRDLIERKRRNQQTPRARGSKDSTPADGEKVVDLMDALKASLKASGGRAKAASKPKAASAPAKKSAPKSKPRKSA